MKDTIKEMKLTKLHLRVVKIIDTILSEDFKKSILNLDENLVVKEEHRDIWDTIPGLCAAFMTAECSHPPVDITMYKRTEAEEFLQAALKERCPNTPDGGYYFPHYHWKERLEFLEKLKVDILSGKYKGPEI